MKKLILAIGIICLFLSGPAIATEWVIEDNYIGGGRHSFQNNNGDVISEHNEAAIALFDITGMTVEIDDALNIKVKINTAFSPATAGDGIDYGDLFISTNGWIITGRDDTYHTSNNTDWEYVFHTDILDTDGGNIFRTTNGDDRLSNHFGEINDWNDSYYRRDQLVQFAPTGEAISGTNSFSSLEAGMLIYSFNLSNLGLSANEEIELGFRWTMTCANDVIEGGVSLAAVPEPTTFILLGIGLVGIMGLGKKKYYRQIDTSFT